MKKSLYALCALLLIFSACTKSRQGAYILGKDLTETGCSGKWIVEVDDKQYVSDQNLELLNNELRNANTAFPLQVKLRYTITKKQGCGDRILVKSIDL
jgi:hypothetical protein